MYGVCAPVSFTLILGGWQWAWIEMRLFPRSSHANVPSFVEVSEGKVRCVSTSVQYNLLTGVEQAPSVFWWTTPIYPSPSLFFFDELSKTQKGYVSVKRMVLMAQERSRTIEHLFLWQVSHLPVSPSGRSWMSKCMYFSFPFRSSKKKKKKWRSRVSSPSLPFPLRHPLHLSLSPLSDFFYFSWRDQTPGQPYLIFFFCEER